MIAIAGRFITPPLPGALSSAGGRLTPAARSVRNSPTSRPRRRIPPSRTRDQGPADDPGGEFAEGRVGGAIGAAAAADRGGEFGIGERAQAAGEAGHEKRQDHPGAGLGGSDDAGEHEHAGTDDGPDTEGDQVPAPEHALETASRWIDADRLDAQAMAIEDGGEPPGLD